MVTGVRTDTSGNGTGQRALGISFAVLGAALIAGALTLSAQGKPAAPSVTAGNGKIYIGTYTGDIRIYDEATEKLEDRIILKTGIARSLTPSQDRTRFYVLDSTYEKLEVVDIATRKTLNTYELRSGNKRVRVINLQPDPLNRYLVLLTRTATKLIDRWEIGPATLQQFDLASGQLTRTIPWPRNEERETVNLRFSPDGKFLYFFGEEVIVLETETFTEVETWPYAQPAEGGLGRINFGPVHDFYDAPGTFTGLFTMQDPIQKRRIMGIGKVDLTARKIDFRPIGPAEQVSFAQAPDRKRAYGIKSDIGRYEFWTFDLEKASVVSRQEFKGRPRVVPRVSSNGKIIYVYIAGDTIDLYDAATYRYLRTISMGADQTTELFVVPPAAASSAR
jgi:WD40 repeat protein